MVYRHSSQIRYDYMLTIHFLWHSSALCPWSDCNNSAFGRGKLNLKQAIGLDAKLHLGSSFDYTEYFI